MAITPAQTEPRDGGRRPDRRESRPTTKSKAARQHAELRTIRLVLLGCLLALGALTAALFASSARAAASFSWSVPQLVDHVPASSAATGLTGMSCPSSTFCVGVDDHGGIVTSTDPAGGASAWSAPVVVDPAQRLTAVSCPSSTFCAAIDGSGNVITSTDPSGGAGAWNAPIPIAATYLESISCPSSGLCVVADYTGSVITSTNPTGGASAWTTTSVPGSPYAVTCASTTLCLLDEGSNLSGTSTIRTSTNPTGGSSAWEEEGDVEITGRFAPSCPSTTLCVATSRTGSVGNRGGSIVTSTDPAGGATSWGTPVEVDPGAALMSVTCASTSLCVAINENGEVLTSTEPTAGASAWSAPLKLDTRGTQQFITQDIYDVGMACPSNGLCVAYDSRGNVLTSTNPTGGESGWSTATQVDGANALFDVSCASASLCVAAAEDGSVVTTTDPVGGGWNPPTHIDGTNAIRSISCPSTSLCVAVDDRGNAVTSTAPTSGSSAWKVVHVDSATEAFGNQATLVGVSCPTASFCVAVDNAGNVLTSNEPAGGASAWSAPQYIDNPYGRLEGLTCSTSSLCLAYDGNIVTSTDPAGGSSAWSATTKIGGTGFYVNGLSCVGTTFCIAISRSGEALTSTDPTGGASAWSAPVLIESSIGGYGPESVSCPTTLFCGVIDGNGNAFVSDDPLGGTSTWTGALEADPRYHLGIPAAHAISCPTASLCVAVDDQGNAIVGQPGSKSKGVTEVPQLIGTPSISGTTIVGQTLGESHAEWANEPTSYSYQWERCDAKAEACQPITSATDQTYTLTPADVGATIRVVEWASNEAGTSEPATSPPTEMIEALPAAKEPAPGGGEPPHEHRSQTVVTTSTSSSTTTATKAAQRVVFSTSQLRAWLLGLKPGGKAATIPAILKHGGYKLAFTAPEAGSLSVQWFVMPHGAHAAKKSKRKTVLVASGRVRLSGAGRSTVFLKLTPRGKRLLRHAKRLKVEAKERFVPRAGSAVTAIKGAVITGGR